MPFIPQKYYLWEIADGEANTYIWMKKVVNDEGIAKKKVIIKTGRTPGDIMST